VRRGDGRTWKVINPNVRNRFGEPVGYSSCRSRPDPAGAPESDIATRAEFARHHLWVTRYDPAEMPRPSDIRTSIPGDGLGNWVKQERDLVNEDIVVWHTFGTSHLHARGLADHALRVRRLLSSSRWFLRPQPGAGRAAAGCAPSRVLCRQDRGDHVLPPMRHIGRRATSGHGVQCGAWRTVYENLLCR